MYAMKVAWTRKSAVPSLVWVRSIWKAEILVRIFRQVGVRRTAFRNR